MNLPASLALPAPLLAKRDVKRKCSIVSIWERLKYFVAGQDIEGEDWVMKEGKCCQRDRVSLK